VLPELDLRRLPLPELMLRALDTADALLPGQRMLHATDARDKARR